MHVKNERGFTLIELMVVVALIGVLAALCAHHVLKARAAANEASAIGTVRAVASGQMGFAATCGGGFYSATIATLVAGNYVSPDANLSPKSGYVFTLTPGATGVPDCGTNATAMSFLMTGVPAAPGMGTRAFGANQTGTVWQDITGAVLVEPLVRAGTVSPIQ